MSDELKHTTPGEPDGAKRAPAPASAAPMRVGVGAYPESVTRLIEELAKLPGIGRRSAERLAFFILKSPKAEALELARAVTDVKQRVRHCRVCYNLADNGPDAAATICSICADDRRDRSKVMVVEQPRDLIALEQAGVYKGVYHVLMGRIAPLEGVKAGDLTIHDLLHRVREPGANAGGVPVREVILALNPSLEGDGTGLHLQHALGGAGVIVTRLARGLPTGSQLEFASKAVLADAIQERRAM
ncbi:MAG TPA: recombination mediator RecR [Phycisphaerales bacterium]|nr:recombination mediator RecR [Phycisphaerales bacterium]